MLWVLSCFAAGVIFDILPTLNQDSVARRHRTLATLTAYGIPFQKIFETYLGLDLFLGAQGFWMKFLNISAYGAGAGMTTFVLITWSMWKAKQKGELV